MTPENLEKILKKVKQNASIPENVSVYDEQITDLIPGAIIEMRTGGVPKSIVDECSPSVIITASHYICYELDGYIDSIKNADWHLRQFERSVFRLSQEKEGDTLGGLV